MPEDRGPGAHASYAPDARPGRENASPESRYRLEMYLPGQLKRAVHLAAMRRDMRIAAFVREVLEANPEVQAQMETAKNFFAEGVDN